jgi:hypothetical protein
VFQVLELYFKKKDEAGWGYECLGEGYDWGGSAGNAEKEGHQGTVSVMALVSA